MQQPRKKLSTGQGPPKHQNKVAWKPNAGVKINETEVGGRFRPLSEVTMLKCSKRAVRQAYHNLCTTCAKEQNVCAKCSCQVQQIIGRDASEVEAEQKMHQAMNNKGKSKSQTNTQTSADNQSKAGDLFKAESLEAYAETTRDDEDDGDSDDETQIVN